MRTSLNRSTISKKKKKKNKCIMVFWGFDSPNTTNKINLNEQGIIALTLIHNKMKKIKLIIQRNLLFNNKISKFSVEVNFKREVFFVDRNYRTKILNEVFTDTEWWQEKMATEWWRNNGNFNDTLYRDYLLERIDRQISLQNQMG